MNSYQMRRLAIAATIALVTLAGFAKADSAFQIPPAEVEKAMKQLTELAESDRAGILAGLDAYRIYCKSPAPEAASRLF